MAYTKPTSLLLKGDVSDEVAWVQEKLFDLGCVASDNPFWKSNVAIKNGIKSPDDPRAKDFWVDKDFGTWTENAVIFMQERFLGERKIPLDEISKAGIVDRDVIWALENSDPISQSQGVDPQISKVAPELGVMIIKIWNYYIQLGVKENRGNNRGPYLPASPWAKYNGVVNGGIDAWTGLTPGKGGSGPAWCCYSRTGIEREAYAVIYGKPKYFQSDGRTGLCYANYKWALQQDEPSVIKEYTESIQEKLNFDLASIFRGWVVDKEFVMNGTIKLPTGTAMIMNYGGTSGHTGSVADVIYDKCGKAISIINCEGNISNSADWRKRDLKQSSIKWFIVSPILLDTADYIGVTKDDIILASENERTR